MSRNTPIRGTAKNIDACPAPVINDKLDLPGVASGMVNGHMNYGIESLTCLLYRPLIIIQAEY